MNHPTLRHHAYGIAGACLLYVFSSGCQGQSDTPDQPSPEFVSQQEAALNSFPVCQDPSGTQTVSQPPGTGFYVNRFNELRFAAQFSGTDAGAKIAAAIADLPAAGGIVDATALAGSQDINQDVFNCTTKPGRLLLGNVNFSVAATQHIPSNWEIIGVTGSRLDGGNTLGGTVFTATAALINRPVLKYFNTEFTKTSGVHVNCLGNAGSTGFLIDSNNTIASHDNQFENVYGENCNVGMQWGTSGATGFQSDGIILRNFKFYNNATAGLKIDSQNAGQDSIVERGAFFLSGTHQDGILITFAPLNFSIRNVSIGGAADNVGAGIHLAYGSNSGGSPLYIEACEFEMQPAGHAILLDAPLQGQPPASAPLVLVGNMFSGLLNQNVVELNGWAFVTSIGNRFDFANAVATGTLTSITSIGDLFQYGHNWSVSNGARLISMGYVDGTNNHGDLSLSAGTLTVGGAASVAGNVSAASVSVNGDSFSAGSRGTYSTFLPGQLNTAYTAAAFTPDKGITITRIQVQFKTAAFNCATNFVLRIGNATNYHDLTLIGNYDTIVAWNFNAGDQLGIAVQVPANCTVNPADANVVIQYKMQ